MSSTYSDIYERPTSLVVDPTFGAAGTEAITELINQHYPEQKRHPQVTAAVKFWNGGPDPLDYVSMLYNRGSPVDNIVPHWHYIGFGLSDLHGDDRTHTYGGPDAQSGFGFELTFRLKRLPQEENAPMWPAILLNSLARYVFKTGNILNCGDHLPWHDSLNGDPDSEIKQIIITEDQQLRTLNTANGYLKFRQVVGVMESELQAAQRWNGEGIIEVMSKIPRVGGIYNVTDMNRLHSLFDMCPDYVDEMISNIESEGSKLGHVNAVCSWNSDDVSYRNSVESDEDIELAPTSVHLKFDVEAAQLLPLMAKGRLMKGRYFVFQNIAGQVIVFIPPEFVADMVTVNNRYPLRIQGQALQIFCSTSFTIQMLQQLSMLEHAKEYEDKLPLLFKLFQPHLTITIEERSNLVTPDDIIND